MANNIAERIKLVRQESKRSQIDVAIYLGQSQSYVSKIESGKQVVTAAELKLLSDFYDKPINYFFD